MSEGQNEAGMEVLKAALSNLIAKDEIRDCLYRYCRGLDRIDRTLIESAFHHDAHIDYGVLFNGPAPEFIDASLAVQTRQVHCQHLVGNILIELDDDTAAVESYEIARHKTPQGDKAVDMFLAARTLDRFEKRNGRWAIAYRKKVLDSGRFLDADESIHDRPPMTLGVRDDSDASYALFAGTLGKN